MSVQETKLAAIADAIRDRDGTTAPISAGDFPARIRAIPGGIELESITITAPPAKTSYLAGESFDPAGMAVTATYSNGATLAATGYAVEPAGPLADGTTSVTVRYTEGGVSATAAQPITVLHRLTGISIGTPPSKTQYQVGEVFDPAGMAVLAAYSDGASAAVTGYTVPTSAFTAPGAQEVAVGYTENGVTASASVAVTVARIAIETVPSQSGSLTYTGEALTPQWEDYDPVQLTLGGTASAVNAGEYAATFTPADNYQWSDGTTGARSVVWSIGKAAGSVTVSPAAVTLDADHPTAEIQVTRAGDGAISAVSSDPGVVAVSVSGTTVTVSSVGEASGSATITVNVAESDNHLAASGTAEVTAAFVLIYGVEWDGDPSTKLSRTDDAARFTDPVPAVGTGSGSSPFDNLMPWSGMTRVTDGDNVLVAIPKYWVKVSHMPFKVQISPTAVDGFQVSPAHRDREDGQGERNVVYIGRYECDGSYMSRSGQAPKVSTPLATFRSGIQGLGATYWQADYALQLTWWFLYIVEFADWNGQTAIGQGNASSSAAINTGATDSMTYHTGRAAGTDGQTAIQYRNIENPWGNVREWRDGIIFSGANISTYNNPANFSNAYDGTGATVRSNKRTTISGWIKAWGHDSNDPSFIYPSEVGGPETTFAPDYCFYSTGVRALLVGGDYGNGAGAGPFCLSGNFMPTNANASLGSRLQKLPNSA